LQRLHLGASVGYRDDIGDGARLRARPPSHLYQRIVDTRKTPGDPLGSSPIDNAWIYGVELAWIYGPWSVQAEYAGVDVSQALTSDPSFSGWYVEASYWLTGEALELAISGATVFYPHEVPGAPCTIKCHPDGSMTGVVGFSNEEQDTGRWRIEGDRFYRQWHRWNYGEEKGYYIVIDGDKIKYFNSDKQIVDSAFIRLADGIETAKLAQ